MGDIDTEGRDSLLWRDKRKRNRGCGSVGLYLYKRKNTDHGMEKKKKTEKEPVSNRTHRCKMFSGLEPITLFAHLGRRRASPSLSLCSKLRDAIGENSPLIGCTEQDPL